MLNTFKRSQVLYKNKPWSKFLVLVTLGTMVLAVCSLLCGCGSDNTPGGAVKGKEAKKIAKPEATKKETATAILLDSNKGQIKPQPQPKGNIEMFPDITQAELDAKAAASRVHLESSDLEVFPGITQKELMKKQAAEKPPDFKALMGSLPGAQRGRQPAAASQAQLESSDLEVAPGITQRELMKKQAAEEPPTFKALMESLPGAAQRGRQ